MSADYPYMMSNNKISPIIDSIHTAAKPAKFSHEFLKKLGYGSSNDRAIIPLFKKLGFLTESGVPTPEYDDLKDKTRQGGALAHRIRELYNDIYSINTKIHNGTEEEIKGAISRVTGRDAKTVDRLHATFMALVNLADFDAIAAKKQEEQEIKDNDEAQNESNPITEPLFNTGNNFHYNIQIHLPATTDISVYNVIFKSLKDNLIL